MRATPSSIDPFLAAASCAVLGACAVIAPWPSTLVVLAVACALALPDARSIGRLGLVFAAVAFVIGAVRCTLVLRAHGRAAAAAERALPHPSRCAFEGTVVGMPLRRGVLGAEVLVHALDCEGRREASLETSPPLRVRLHDLPADVVRGDRLAVVAQLARARRIGSFDLGDDRVLAARRSVVVSGTVVTASRVASGEGGWALLAPLDALRVRLRAGLERSVPAEVAPIARALVLGEEDLTEDDGEAFRRSGLTHLLAVSGSHVALAVGTLVALLRVLLLRVTWLARRVEVGRVAAALGIPLACAYEQIAGDSGSARRATAMAAVVLLARAAGRRTNVVRTLSLSVLAALVIDPLAPFDLSFSLSLAATMGLVGLGPPLRELLDALVPRVPKMIRSALGTTMSASVACAPLVARIAGSLPVLGLLANVVAVPIGELAALPLANLSALIGASRETTPLAAWPAEAMGKATAGALVALRAVARVAAAPSWSVLRVPPPTPMQLALLVSVACVVHVLRARGRRLLAVLLVACAAFLLCEEVQVRAGAPRGRLRVTVLDVGQGDATLVDFPQGQLMLIDGGGEVGTPFDPGKAVVSPTLDMRRRRRIDVMVLTHPHPDHFLGLRAVLDRYEVGALWDTGQGESEGAGPSYAALLEEARRRGIPVVRPEALCGPARWLFGAEIEVLHPCPRFDPDRGPNDNSLVLRIGYGSRRALLMGDAERWAEARVLASNASNPSSPSNSTHLHADFLKVGHHGSRTSSTPALLAAVGPTFAAISCGVRNRFGHPHPAALATLTAAGVRVFRTDRDGVVAWTTDGHGSWLATSREEW